MLSPDILSTRRNSRITVTGGKDKIGFYTAVSIRRLGTRDRVFRDASVAEQEAKAAAYATEAAQILKCKVSWLIEA